MKVYTPQISWHNRHSLLSVDIQNRPFGGGGQEDPQQPQQQLRYRLATGGNDSRVNIFRVAFNSSERTEEAAVVPNKPRVNVECLAELTSHQRPVNIVRFSPNLEDNYLAAGDDDSLIFIWKLYEAVKEDGGGLLETSSTNADGSKGLETAQQNGDAGGNMLEDVIAVETWKPFKILRGHNQDVTDLAWSRDGKRLVSGSVDNNVFVWDVARGSKLQKVLKEHNSYVQGVAYDPLNRYIASLSADRSMLVFNVNTGKTVHRVYKLTTGEKENNKDKEKEKEKDGEAEKENEVKSEEVKAQDEPVEAPAETKKTTTSTSSKLFFDQTLTSFCRRLTFSPGGELLFAPSGIIETGGPEEYKNTVHVFQRSNLSR